jgi:two-component system, NarL family, nitrate/nitrite response regulator NarL
MGELVKRAHPRRTPAAGRGSPPVVSVAIGDRHPLFRDAMARAIRADRGLRLMSEAEDPWAALADVARLRPDVAVVDPSAPSRGDDEFLALLPRVGGTTRFVVLTARDDAALAFRAVAGGAAAVLGKSVDGDQLCRAVVAVGRGESVLAPAAQSRIAAELRARRLDGRTRLTAREHQVLTGIAAGLSGPQVADHLQLGRATVKTYLARLYAKLGVSDRAAAVAQAMRDGLLE